MLFASATVKHQALPPSVIDGHYTHFSGDPSVLNCPQTDTVDDPPPPILRREVEAAVQSLKKGKSAGVDNIPAELVQAGGEDVITALTTVCDKIWQTGEWPTPWTQSLVITLPKKGNLQQCHKPHQSPKQSHAEDHTEQIEATSGEDYRRRTGRFQSTTEQIFNLRILCEKYLQHQQDLSHVFIYFKKAFDRVWHAALWATMKKYNISTNLI